MRFCAKYCRTSDAVNAPQASAFARALARSVLVVVGVVLLTRLGLGAVRAWTSGIEGLVALALERVLELELARAVMRETAHASTAHWVEVGRGEVV